MPLGSAERRGWLVAARTMGGGHGCSRPSSGTSDGGRRGPGKGESERGGQRDRDDTGKSSTRPGDRRQAGGGRERTRARHASRLPTGRRKKTALPSVGWAAQLGRQQ